MNKEEIKLKASEALADAKAKIQELDDKKDSISAELKAEFQEKIEAIRAKKDELEAKIDAIEDDAEDKWEEIKDILADSLQSFKEGFVNLGRLFD
jgi:predicted  nucleic acid-binding Zn-ribbon protein